MKKIIGIFICMLLATSAFGSSNIVNTTYDSIENEKILNQEVPQKSIANGTFWIDLSPGGGHDGGKFEDEDDKWNIGKVITQDDFDDTSELIDWANSDGIYSKIRDDEDLWDNTSDEGAWCVAAAEQVSLGFAEDSQGYTWMNTTLWRLDEYIDVNLSNFEITNATLYCDYKMKSTDFDDIRDYVYFNIFIYDLADNGSDDLEFFEFQEHSGNDDAPENIGEEYIGDGYCTDYWDPGDGHVNPDDTIDNYQVSKMESEQTLADYLNVRLTNHRLSINFWIDIRLYGEQILDTELFKFWLDDFGILCNYTYNQPPYKPSNPVPEDEETNVPVNVNLNWTGGDPDDNPVTYDVYFGETSPPPNVANNTTQGYKPDNITFGKTYYWRIVAWDNYSAHNESPIWSFTTEGPEPDLDCEGSLSWIDVGPGATVTGNFTVENIGDPGSLLDWEVDSYPSWGEWIFIPFEGNDLTPEDGTVTVQVMIIAPNEQNTEFSGTVKVANKHNSSDFCTIDVTLATPKNQLSVQSYLVKIHTYVKGLML